MNRTNTPDTDRRTWSADEDGAWVGPVAESIEEAALEDVPSPRTRLPLRERLTTVAALSIGGVLGAEARYGLGRLLTPRWHGDIPWTTLLINLSGSFVLGLYLTLVTERTGGRSTTRLFFATGVVGSYTTFSTFSYESVRLLQDGSYGAAAAYVGLSLVGGLLLAALGVLAAYAR